MIPAGSFHFVVPVFRSTTVTGLFAPARKPSSVPWASENWLGAQSSGEQAAPAAAPGSRRAAGENEQEALHGVEYGGGTAGGPGRVWTS